MLNNYFNKLDSTSKLVSIFLLILTIFIAKSILLLISLTVLSLIFLILIDKSVNIYISSLKTMKFWLIIIWIVYIIFLGMNVGSLIFIYKLLLSVLLIVGIFAILNFNELHLAIYAIFSLFKFIKFDCIKLSYSVTMNIYFLKYLMSSDNKIRKSQFMNGKNKYNLKCFCFPKILYSIEKMKLFEESLNLKFYKLQYRKMKFGSLIFMFCFIFLFIIAVFKEVVF